MKKALRKRFGKATNVAEAISIVYRDKLSRTERYRDGLWVTKAEEIAKGGRIFIPTRTEHKRVWQETNHELRTRAQVYHRFVQSAHACWQLGIEPQYLLPADAERTDSTGRRIEIKSLVSIARTRQKGEATIKGLRHKGRSIWDWADADPTRYQRIRRSILRGVDIATAIEDECYE